jgi:hypothetical protein
MDPESKKYTIILVLVVLLIAWYYSKSSNESFKSKRGINTKRSSITNYNKLERIQPSRKLDNIPIVVATPPPHVNVPKVINNYSADFDGLF